jgi:hypothetical protein
MLSVSTEQHAIEGAIAFEWRLSMDFARLRVSSWNLLNASGAAAAQLSIRGKTALVRRSSREIRAPWDPRAEPPAAEPLRGASGARVQCKGAGPIPR